MLVVEGKYKVEEAKNELGQLASSVVRTLLYFDIFNYPLTLDEIHRYCSLQSASKCDIHKQLEAFEDMGYISRVDKFYLTRNDNMQALVKRRMEGNQEAERFLRIAKKFSRFISFFPFVRSICLSGSLSKGYADSESDIDYFIITEPGRLWIARTMLVMFKKLFLFNSHKYFCVNYFIDTNSLEIPDRNLFAATELLSVIPMLNAELYERLMQSNTWIKDYYPNAELRAKSTDILPANSSLIRRFGEKIFSGRFGNWADDLCFRLTLSAWKRKFKDFNTEEFDLRLRTRKNVSKHHPNGFQTYVLNKYEEKVKAFEKEHNVSL